nr:uncharacterized mitochondrial protein AtMg00810-like [Tanacetum cinerariifolium]
SAFGTKFQAPRVPTVNKKFPTVNRKFPTVNRKFPTGNIKFSTGDLGGSKITGKGTIKTECIVLGQNFKLTDETNVLLRTPRQHNMYSIDLNNVVPHKDLTCLVAKASADECMLWHKRLGKFKAKRDEGYFIRYSMSSKAFRVFNKRTKRVEENLHVDFLENKAIEKGAGSNWLFDIDSLTNSMNYVPVVVTGINSTNFSGIKEAAGQDVKKDMSSLRYIALPNWFHETHLESSISNAQDTCNADAPERNGNSNPAVTSTYPPANHMETLAVETLILTDPEFLARVYKVEKAMHGLHQAPRAWYVLQKKDGISLSQEKYVGDILKKFRYSDVRSANTSMDKANPWGKDRTGKDVDLHLYRSMIGSLMYLTASRPDIMFAVCACARNQVTPKECYLHVVKRIFRYLKGHPKLGLWYPKESPFDLVAYSDSDYDGATQDCKSTTRGCQFLGRRLILWQCKKQTIVATSTTEAEYVAAASGCGQVL